MDSKKLITPSGYFGNSSRNIVVLEDFVEKNDLLKLQTFCKTLNTFESIPGDNWDNRVCSSKILKNLDLEIFKLLNDKYLLKIKKEIENFFNVVLNHNSPSIVLWREKDGQLPHADKELEDGSPNPYPWNDIASLVYLTDDYVGGEIYFPKQNICIKPKAGQAIFFPGDKEYLHGVTEIMKGKRLTSPSFWNIVEHKGEVNA